MMAYEGTIAYCSREDHWAPAFGRSLAALTRQHPNVRLIHSVGNRIARQRNIAVQEMAGDWIFFLDTDVVFHSTILERLLGRSVEVVQALQLRREPPFDPIPNFGPLQGPPGLARCAFVGAGCTLYRRSALDKIRAPYFAGELGDEDLYCSQQLIHAGVTLWCDLSVSVGHVVPMAAKAHYEDGKWSIRHHIAHAPELIASDEVIQCAHEWVWDMLTDTHHCRHCSAVADNATMVSMNFVPQLGD